MRQGQQNRRGRGRGRKSQNSLSRNLESNGPDVKIRGTASHIAEKYAGLARDALASGDNITAENYLQHAEHYQRMIMAAQSQQSGNAQADADESGGQRGKRGGQNDGGNRHPGNDGGDEQAARSNERGRKKGSNGADNQPEEKAANGSGAAMKEESAESDAPSEAPQA